MSVGCFSPHRTMIGGNLTLTLCDGEGNVKSIQTVHNQIGVYAFQAMASAIGNGEGISAIYIYLFSAMNGALTQSMGAACSGYGSCVFTNKGAAGPLTASWAQGTYNPTGAASCGWLLTGTMGFTGCASKTSVDAAAINFGSAATWVATMQGMSATWFAQASFADLAITSVDSLSFIWVFSISNTVSAGV